MQNQLTPGQSNLQQSTPNLQPNSNNLQQGGTPNTSSEVFTVLSQDAKTNGLTVRSAQTDPSKPSQTYLPSQSASVWIVPLAFAVAVVVAVVLWSRLRSQEQAIEEVPVVVEKPSPPIPKKSKTGKKTTRRKRQSKR